MSAAAWKAIWPLGQIAAKAGCAQGGTRRGTGLAGVLLTGALLWPSLATAQSSAQVRAGQDKARSCAVCHGQVGISTVPNAPNLAGQPALYVAEQLKAYRSGKRPNEIMSVIAKPLSDDDIADLAAWYAAIRIEATAP